MTTKLKKLLTSLLAFSLVLGMLPMGTMASAANITNDNNVKIEEYHILKGDTIAKLEEAAKKLNPEQIVTDKSLYQIHIIFQDAPLVTLFPLHGVTDYWHGLVDLVHKKNQQPGKVLSIEMGYGSDLDPHFLTISADYLNIQCFDKILNDIAQISLNESAVAPDPTPVDFTLSFQYVVPAGFDNVQPAPENIIRPTEVTRNTPFDFGTPPYGTMTIPESYAFHGWYSDEICQTPMNETDQITQNTTVYGYWTKTPAPTYTLTFAYVTEGVDGAVAPPEGVTVQGAILFEKQYRYEERLNYGTGDIPAGYQFHGWFLYPNCTTPASTSTVVTKNDTLYGYWTKTPEPPAPTTYAFSVSYVFTDGKKPEGAFIDYVEQLEAAVTYTAVAIDAPDGYTRTVTVDDEAAEVPVSGEMPAKPVSVIFTYTPTLEPPAPTTYTFSVSYVFTDESVHDGFQPRTTQLKAGDHYKAEALAAPAGYRLTDNFVVTDNLPLEGEMPAKPVSVTFHYEHDAVTPPTEPPVTPPSPSYSYYRATVRYLALDTNAVLADAYSTDTIREGRSYDVSEQAALAISGYTIDHVEGATSGTLNGNVTVTVWYSAETVLENPDVPLVDVPEVPPTTPPAPDVSGETGEVILVDPETPLGDLPQTGIVAEAADPASTLGFAALAASMAMAGLAIALNRKREDAE